MATPIEILGGGLAGLSLGVALRRHDVPVRLYEAGDYPRHRVCGEFITGLDASTIRELGLERILADALVHREVAWFHRDQSVQVHTLPKPALGISRHTLDARLAAAFVAAGGELHARTRITDLTPRAGRVFAMGRRRGPSEWLGLKVHLRGIRLERDLELHLGDDGYVGLSRVENGWINVCGLLRNKPRSEHRAPAARPPSATAGELDARGPSRRDAGVPGILLEHLHACGLAALATRLADAEIEPGSFCSVAALQFNRHVATADRIQLGDACAMIPPFTGNGMAMAFQSAATALEPLRQYSAGERSWRETCDVTNRALRQRFRVRLASADWLHPFLLRRNRQRGLAALSRTGLLPFRPLYALLH